MFHLQNIQQISRFIGSESISRTLQVDWVGSGAVLSHSVPDDRDALQL